MASGGLAWALKHGFRLVENEGTLLHEHKQRQGRKGKQLSKKEQTTEEREGKGDREKKGQTALMFGTDS